MHKIFIRPKTDIGRDAYRGRMPVFDMGNGSVMRLFPGRSEVITDAQLAVITPQLSTHADRVQVVALSPAPLSLVTDRSEAPTLEPNSIPAPPTDDPPAAETPMDAESAEAHTETQQLDNPDAADEDPVAVQEDNDEEPSEEAPADASTAKRRGRRSRAARS